MSATSAHQDLSFLLQDDSDRQRLLYNGGGQGYGASAGGGGTPMRRASVLQHHAAEEKLFTKENIFRANHCANVRNEIREEEEEAAKAVAAL